MAEFILETENRLGRETRPRAKNSSYINPVIDEFAVANLSVYFFPSKPTFRQNKLLAVSAGESRVEKAGIGRDFKTVYRP